MAPSKMQKPHVQCSDWKKVEFDVGYANQGCYAVFDNKRCEGVFISMVAPGDWEECDSCQAMGQTNQSPCTKCSGTGWINVRSL
jgi:DnaJ-class molecular chaperone